jgi:hypothetical protein
MRVSLGNPVDVDKDGLLVDIEVHPIEEDPPAQDKRRDIDQFFHPAVLKSIGDKIKKYSMCKLCPYVYYSPIFHLLIKTVFGRDKKSLVNEITTLRRHLEAHHSVGCLKCFLIFCLSD